MQDVKVAACDRTGKGTGSTAINHEDILLREGGYNRARNLTRTRLVVLASILIVGLTALIGTFAYELRKKKRSRCFCCC